MQHCPAIMWTSTNCDKPPGFDSQLPLATCGNICQKTRSSYSKIENASATQKANAEKENSAALAKENM